MDENILEQMRLLARAPAPAEPVSKFGAKLNPRIERRVARYAPLIDKYARANDIDPELVKAVVRQESMGSRHAVSPTGVRGLMQVTQDTFKAYGPKGAKRTDPEASIAAGTSYLGYLLDKYGGDQVKALAHYNSGGAAGRNPRGARPQGKTYVHKILGVDVNKDYAPGKFIDDGYPEPVSNVIPPVDQIEQQADVGPGAKQILALL